MSGRARSARTRRSTRATGRRTSSPTCSSPSGSSSCTRRRARGRRRSSAPALVPWCAKDERLQVCATLAATLLRRCGVNLPPPAQDLDVRNRYVFSLVNALVGDLVDRHERRSMTLEEALTMFARATRTRRTGSPAHGRRQLEEALTPRPERPAWVRRSSSASSGTRCAPTDGGRCWRSATTTSADWTATAASSRTSCGHVPARLPRRRRPQVRAVSGARRQGGRSRSRDQRPPARLVGRSAEGTRRPGGPAGDRRDAAATRCRGRASHLRRARAAAGGLQQPVAHPAEKTGLP